MIAEITYSQQAVLRMLANGSRTDEEIAEEWARMAAREGRITYARSTLRNARVALMKAHWVIDTGRQRNRAAVWALKGPRHLGVLSNLNFLREKLAQAGRVDGLRRCTPPQHRAVS